MEDATMREGACHCGAVTFRAPVGLEGLIECNCTHCAAKGFILGFVPRAQLEILSGADNLTTYRFNTHNLAHQFCRTCGVQGFATGKGPDGSEMAGINVRALKGVDVAALDPAPFDGLHKF